MVQGTASEVLRDATGIECSTLASLLARLDAHADDASRPSPVDARTVVLVDESLTLPNRELVRLARYAERAGSGMRLIGDPAQHSAVAAGGAGGRCSSDTRRTVPSCASDAGRWISCGSALRSSH